MQFLKSFLFLAVLYSFYFSFYLIPFFCFCIRFCIEKMKVFISPYNGSNMYSYNNET